MPFLSKWSLRLILACIGCAGLTPLQVTAADPAAGQLLERISCNADASQSYALYLPSSYDPARAWPVLYCFDPRARGARAISCFQEGAEKFGYILVGLNNSRNGPWEANRSAIEAVLRDTHSRFSINRARLYTAGMSGGARVATRLGLAGLTAGVVACSGGFPTQETPPKLPFVFFGTAGIDDCNYDEMRRIDDDLDRASAVHRVEIFNGGHEWLPVTLGTRAIEWLELQAMRRGLRPRDEALIDAIFEARVAAIPTAVPEAWMEVKSLLADFQGLRPVADLEKQMAALAGSRELRDWRKQEKKASGEATLMVNEIVAAAHDGSAAGMKRIFDKWRAEAAAAEDSPRRRVVRRALQGAAITLEQTARAHFSLQEYEPAAAMFEAVLLVQPARPGLYFDLARCRASSGENAPALRALAEAVASGYENAGRFATEPAFAPLRDDPEFAQLLAKVKARALSEAASSESQATSAARK